MKTFLKVVLVILAAFIALKLLPLTLLAGIGLGVGIVLLGVLTVSTVAVLLCAAIALAALLSPAWIPLLALVGLIAFVKRLARGSKPVVA